MRTPLVALALALALALTLPAGAVPIPPITFLNGGPCYSGAPDGETVYAEGFEGGLGGWTFVSQLNRPNLWHLTEFRGNNSDADDDLFHDGPGRLYYGIENALGGTYNTSRMRNQGDARSPPIPIPAGEYAIEFATKWHVEWDRPWLIDAMLVGYVVEGGSAAQTTVCYVGNVWAGYSNIVMGYGYYQNSPTGQAVLTACEYSLESPQNPCRVTQDLARVDTSFDLAPETTFWEHRFIHLPASLAGKTIRMSFHFQTGDAIVDDAMGWMIDDVRLVKTG